VKADAQTRLVSGNLRPEGDAVKIKVSSNLHPILLKNSKTKKAKKLLELILFKDAIRFMSRWSMISVKYDTRHRRIAFFIYST
jgi:hypothetical protein